MIIFAVCTFESMQAWFILFSFEPRRIGFEVSLVILCKLMVVFGFVWTIAFNIP